MLLKNVEKLEVLASSVDVDDLDGSGLTYTQVDALVHLLARADQQEVSEVFSALGPQGARRLGRALRRASETTPMHGEVYRRAIFALICADLAQPFN